MSFHTSQPTSRSQLGASGVYSPHSTLANEKLTINFANDFEDAPPGYQPSTSGSNRLQDKKADMQSADERTEEDRLRYLRNFDTVVLLDDSSSMSIGNRWGEAEGALKFIASKAAQYDADGIDLHFLNKTKSFKNLKTQEKVAEAFTKVRPDGYTPIGRRLRQLTDEYVKRYTTKPSIFSLKKGVKPLNLIVITDGEPTDEPICDIQDVVKKMESLNMPYNQIGIQFVQIGNEPGATIFLKKLDDDLDLPRDIVDTVAYNGTPLSDHDYLVKILLGGILRKIDNDGR